MITYTHKDINIRYDPDGLRVWLADRGVNIDQVYEINVLAIPRIVRCHLYATSDDGTRYIDPETGKVAVLPYRDIEYGPDEELPLR